MPLDSAPSTCPSSFLGPLEPFPKEPGPRILEYESLYGSEHRCRLERQAGSQEKVPRPGMGGGGGEMGVGVLVFDLSGFAQGHRGLPSIETQAQNQLKQL